MAVMPCPNPHCTASLPATARACPACGVPLHGVLYRGRYQVTNLVQRGEITFTYQATDTETGEPVELRVVVVPDPGARAMLVAEARAISRLALEGVQRVRTVLDKDGLAIVLDPPPLDPSHSFAPLADETLRGVAWQSASLLEELHAGMVMHRALRPDNLRLDKQWRVALSGWGWDHWISATLGMGLSRTSREHGHYLAPEAMEGKGEPSADLYGLGVTLMHLATGKQPAELFDHEVKAFAWRDDAKISPELADVIDALLRAKDGDRIPSARELLKRLQPLRPVPEGEAPEPPEPPPPSPNEPPARPRRRHAGLWRWALLAPLVALFFPAWPLADMQPPSRPSRMRVVASFARLRDARSPSQAGRPPAPSPKPLPTPTPPPLLHFRRLGPPHGATQLSRAARHAASPPASGSPRVMSVVEGLKQIVAEAGAPSTWTAPDPREVPKAIEIHVSRLLHSLEIYQGSLLLQRFPVGVGIDGSTPVGSFAVTDKAKEPSYRAPNGRIVPGGVAQNPLGKRWIGLQVVGRHGIGIHGTNDPDSIGTDCSQGCIRMRNEDVQHLYEAIGAGARVVIDP